MQKIGRGGWETELHAQFLKNCCYFNHEGKASKLYNFRPSSHSTKEATTIYSINNQTKCLKPSFSTNGKHLTTEKGTQEGVCQHHPLQLTPQQICKTVHMMSPVKKES